MKLITYLKTPICFYQLCTGIGRSQDDFIETSNATTAIATIFCPADDHVKPTIIIKKPKFIPQEGQFSDAEED
ncbi:hypothetical protein CHUAL_003451 [Chamberlinius hualienensis]